MSMISRLMQNVTMSTPSRAQWFLSSMNPSFFSKKGAKQAVGVFREAVNRVPAYRKFLKKSKFTADDVKDIESFKEIPLMNKKNYIQKYPLQKRCMNGDLAQMYAVSTSSGATGKPTYWPRNAEADKIIPKAIDLLLKDVFDSEKESVLMVVTLSMGLWGAGDMATTGLRALSAKANYKFTTVMPGLRVKETIAIIKDIGANYDHIFLVGYPPFVKDIIEMGIKRRVNWKKLQTKIMMGGEGISEYWRNYIMSKIGTKDIYDVSNLFATSDSGIIAFETPFSIIVRRLAEGSKEINERLFDNNKTVAVTQYNPMAKYIEVVDDKIVVTSVGGVPLVRYDLGDRGTVISFKRVTSVLEDAGVNIKKEMKKYGYDFDKAFRLPIFAAYGRSDAVHFYAVNVYRENIMAALDVKGVAEYVTGRFKLGVIEDKRANQKLEVKLEMRRKKKVTVSLQKKIQVKIHDKVSELNSEYNELSKYLSTKKKKPYMLDVELFPYKDRKYFSSFDIKHNYKL